MSASVYLKKNSLIQVREVEIDNENIGRRCVQEANVLTLAECGRRALTQVRRNGKECRKKEGKTPVMYVSALLVRARVTVCVCEQKTWEAEVIVRAYTEGKAKKKKFKNRVSLSSICTIYVFLGVSVPMKAVPSEKKWT